VTSRAPTAPVLEIPFEEVIPKEVTVVVEQEPISTPRQLAPADGDDDDFDSEPEEFEQLAQPPVDDEDVVVVVDQHAPKKYDVFEDEIELDSDDESAPSIKPSASSESGSSVGKRRSSRLSTRKSSRIEQEIDDEDPNADFLSAMLKKPINK